MFLWSSLYGVIRNPLSSSDLDPSLEPRLRMCSYVEACSGSWRDYEFIDHIVQFYYY